MEGYCAATRFGGNCQRGSSGAWPLRETSDLKAASEECLRQCAGCAQCRYVSVAAEHGDCSWFARCDMSRLERRTTGFVTFAANATIGASVDGRNKALQRRRRREERHRAAVNEAGESLQGGRVPDEEPRQRQWRQGVLVLALGVLSVDSKAEAARRRVEGVAPSPHRPSPHTWRPPRHTHIEHVAPSPQPTHVAATAPAHTRTSYT
eukprot:scaffold15437_cov71-Phaeocystis_antarctica.AAC.2